MKQPRPSMLLANAYLWRMMPVAAVTVTWQCDAVHTVSAAVTSRLRARILRHLMN